jgi:cytidine deaminase
MKFRRLSKEDIKLVSDAKGLIKRRLSERSCVAASLRTKSQKIYNGINIEIKECPPCSVCAEYAAIAQMFSDGKKEIQCIVAVRLKKNKFSILSPCGKCRQLISLFGDPYIILELKGNLQKVKLSQIMLFPHK